MNNVTDEKLVKCIIELNKIFFPKKVTKTKGGEFAIFSADIIEKGCNCEALSESIKLKGVTCSLEPLKQYKVTCKLADSSDKYGDTYEIVFINSILDLSDKIKQRNFLMSILNEKIVTSLFSTYDDVIELLENHDIKSLTTIKGIGTTTALKMIDKYEESKDYSAVYSELGHLGLSSKLIKRLVDYYNSPDTVVEQVKNNPYDLVNVDGIGFKKADEIASKLGISGSNPNRVRGCMLYLLQESGMNGRSYLHYQELLSKLSEIIGYVEENIINMVAQDLIKRKEIVVLENGQFVGIKKYYELEKNIHKELIRLHNAKSNIDISNLNVDDSIRLTEEQQGFNFTEEQIESIHLFVKSNVMALTGLAGSGKSSTAKGMSDIFKKYIINAVALSGKASVRITEATGLEASTIHRLLNFMHGAYTFNSMNQLECDILLIDEATMINGELFLALLQATPSGAKVIMMGDVQQLTPIGSCQVFADILNANIIPVYWLTKPHRQALESGIIPTSIKVAKQEHIINSNFEGNIILGNLKDMELDIFKNNIEPSNLVVSHFMKHFNELDNLMEVQVVVPMRLRGDLSCYNINNKIQALINPINENRKSITTQLDKDHQYFIQIGDKVINTKNNYNTVNVDGDITPVFNGNIGIVTDIDDDLNVIVNFIGVGEIIIPRDSSQALELAYACTCHKMQGSGFKRVIVGVDSSSYVLNNAEWLYTAITRAKQYCVLVGKNSAIRQCINKREVKNKQTYLPHFLNNSLQ